MKSLIAVTSLFLTVLAGSVVAQDPPILLVIDVSDLTAVSINATGAAPAIDDNVTVTSFGVTLDGLFADTGIGAFAQSLLGNLTAAGASEAYDTATTDEFFSLDTNGLSLIASPSSLQVFSVSAPAFAGQGVIDFDLSFSAFDPPDDFQVFSPTGTTGSILIGDPANGVSIGRYAIVVPEVSSAALAVVLAGQVGCFGRRRLHS